MTEAASTQPFGMKVTEPRSFNFGFGQFKVDVSSYLSNESVKKLATLFDFSPAKFDRVRDDSLEFVRLLEEEGIITPTDISTLTSALRSSGQGGIAKKVHESFEKNQRRDSIVPGVVTPELQRKHSILVNALKKLYRKRYRGVKPVPFLHDNWRCVNDIFVESKIEVSDNSKSKKDPTRWSSIKSRHEVFTNPAFERHITIEGEPGYGKSTLLLQYAYDWDASLTESPLTNSYIFILLRLKDVTDTPNVYDAIKMMLPEDLQITREDIKDIVTSGHWKVVLALDGYDEYSGMGNTSSDINKIIEGRLLTACLIIITTRPSCLPKLQSATVTHCKLTGFDQSMQEKYIDKAITSQAVGSGMKELIMRKLKENVVLSDICQVPLFFATFAHMSNIGAECQKLNSVTSYFTFMLTSFLGHLENKAMELRRGRQSLIENPSQRFQIAKLAFDGLTSEEQKLLWRKDELLKLLERPCYNTYIDAGILLEEEHGGYKVTIGRHSSDQMEIATYVRFFHKTFQEFYAAHYIAHLAETQSANALMKILSKFDLNNYQYVMRFACGLEPTTVKVVQDYLSSLGGKGRMFSILCIMEQDTGAVDSTIAQLCSKLVMLMRGQNRLQQRSTIQLLQTASQRNIPISSVQLRFSFQSVDLKEECLCLSSGLQLPRLDTLEELVIFGRGDLRDRARDILDYSARCMALETLTYNWVQEQLEAPLKKEKKFLFVKDWPGAIDGHFDKLPKVPFKHTFIIRNPLRSAPSFRKTCMKFFRHEGNVDEFNMIQGNPYTPIDLPNPNQLHAFWQYVKNNIDPNPVVIDSDDLQNFPEQILRKYCEAVGIPFNTAYLNWDSGKETLKGINGPVQLISGQADLFVNAVSSSSFSPVTSEPPSFESLTSDEQKYCSSLLPGYEEMYLGRIKPES